MGSDNGSTEYEAIRMQRLEENKRRMQELGISELSQSLSKSVQTTNSKPTKQRAPKDDFPIEVRRSSRVMNGPQPNYCDAAYDFHLPKRSYPRINRLPRRYASDIERIKTAERANKLHEEMQSGNPSFVKLMLVSHVSGGFWLGLPMHFCKKNLPKDDGPMVLEDENGGEWDSVYLAHRTGLSGGWRGFAMDHGLEDGDAIIFELIKPRRFKVYIVRVSEVVRKEGDENDKENVNNKSKGDQKRKIGEPTKSPKEEGDIESRKVPKRGKKGSKEEGGSEVGKPKALVKKGKKSPKEEEGSADDKENVNKAKGGQRR